MASPVRAAGLRLLFAFVTKAQDAWPGWTIRYSQWHQVRLTRADDRAGHVPRKVAAAKGHHAQYLRGPDVEDRILVPKSVPRPVAPAPHSTVPVATAFRSAGPQAVEKGAGEAFQELAQRAGVAAFWDRHQRADLTDQQHRRIAQFPPASRDWRQDVAQLGQGGIVPLAHEQQVASHSDSCLAHGCLISQGLRIAPPGP